MAQGPRSRVALPDPGRNLGRAGNRPALRTLLGRIRPKRRCGGAGRRIRSDGSPSISADQNRRPPLTCVTLAPFCSFPSLSSPERRPAASFSSARCDGAASGSLAGAPPGPATGPGPVTLDRASLSSLLSFFSSSNGAAVAHGWPSRWRRRQPDPSPVRALTQGWTRRRRAV